MSDERERFLERRLAEDPGDLAAYAGLCGELERRGERPRRLQSVADALAALRRRKAARAVLGLRRDLRVRERLHECSLVYRGAVESWMGSSMRWSSAPIPLRILVGLPIEWEVTTHHSRRDVGSEDPALVVRGALGYELQPMAWAQLLLGAEVVASSVVLLEVPPGPPIAAVDR